MCVYTHTEKSIAISHVHPLSILESNWIQLWLTASYVWSTSFVWWPRILLKQNFVCSFKIQKGTEKGRRTTRMISQPLKRKLLAHLAPVHLPPSSTTAPTVSSSSTNAALETSFATGAARDCSSFLTVAVVPLALRRSHLHSRHVLCLKSQGSMHLSWKRWLHLKMHTMSLGW